MSLFLRSMIQSLGLQHLRPVEVEQIEDAMNSDDVEVMLTLVDKLVGRAIQRTQRRTKPQRREAGAA